MFIDPLLYKEIEYDSTYYDEEDEEMEELKASMKMEEKEKM